MCSLARQPGCGVWPTLRGVSLFLFLFRYPSCVPGTRYWYQDTVHTLRASTMSFCFDCVAIFTRSVRAWIYLDGGREGRQGEEGKALQACESMNPCLLPEVYTINSPILRYDEPRQRNRNHCFGRAAPPAPRRTSTRTRSAVLLFRVDRPKRTFSGKRYLLSDIRTRRHDAQYSSVLLCSTIRYDTAQHLIRYDTIRYDKI